MEISNKPQLVQTEYGFWQYQPAPSFEELSAYYANQYFQQGRGSYAVSYLKEEIQYFRLKPSLMFRQLKRLRDVRKLRSVLDVGCGEGWALDRFHQEGFQVRGVDFSAFGIEKFHPHLREHLEQGNIYEILKMYCDSKESWDVIVLANVIEHVIDPIGLLDALKRLLSSGGLVILVAPNDFSALHQHLLAERIIDTPFWLAYPDHLSYFNKESMGNLLEDRGFKLEAVVADNPIDLNLLNANSNYVQDRTKGKNAHLFRVHTDNFLASIDEEKLLDLYKIYGELGVGRDLNYFCGLKR
jgi:2-polyprenyl-3-methyl-5-hydroxy-6-metoxy-1,4-benzoquinol methylase